MSPLLVVHGHFYQPPRENPWTQEIEREPGAEPFHDWNARIFHECYRPNGYSRVVDDAGRIEHIVNNYAHISFNFGPTLMSWLERHHPGTYGRILDADRESAKARGHGNAIAQGYNHTILPLCSPRDRDTQVRWGLADFRHRFGRSSQGIWLPETGCNDETLETLIEHEVRFTILAPNQARAVRRMGDSNWQEVSGGRVDPSRAYRWFHRDGSGRFIDLFFYDGPKARQIAFEGALGSSHVFLDNLLRHAPDRADALVSVATDGESYGHHSKFSDRCLAHLFGHVASERGVRFTNYSCYLDLHPPEHEVQLARGDEGLGTSWSCAHGVGRWMRDCGCHTGGREGWNQEWRGPLRRALDLLRNEAATLFESRGAELFHDPWAARSDYIDVILGGQQALPDFLSKHAKRNLDGPSQMTALTLLEMQRHAMLMYTSCGWFFSDISGIETRQILMYAGRLRDFAAELGAPLSGARFLELLAEAHSNKPEEGTGADVYRKWVEPARVAPHRIVAHLAMTSLVDDAESRGSLAGHGFVCSSMTRKQHGRITMSTGLVTLTQLATGRKIPCGFAALHLGGIDFFCAVDDAPEPDAFKESTKRLWGALNTASLPTLLRMAAKEMGPDEYGLEHLLPGGRERISALILADLVRLFSEEYAHLYEDNRRALDMLQSAGFELPKELTAAAEFTLGRRFEDEIRLQRESRDPAAYRQAIAIAEEAAEHGYQIDRTESSRTFEHMITHSVRLALTLPTQDHLQATIQLLDLAKRLRLSPILDHAQEAVYDALKAGAAMPPGEMDRLIIALWLSPKLRPAEPNR